MTKALSPIKLFVGLGNPGPQYAATRHNAGFWWLEQAAKCVGAALTMDRSYHGFVARTTWKGQQMWLLEPQLFMNRSGQSVAALARFYKILPNEILVVHDELDIMPGHAKLKYGGGHAGHNGLCDIEAQLGSSDYWRLRIGIGHPGIKHEVTNWVLKPPTQDQLIAIDQTIDRALSALDLLAAGDMDAAMQKIHTSLPPKPKPPRPLVFNASKVPEPTGTRSQ
jgi:PTH1 family peptidyl-tRNA hydrolase